MNDLFLMHIMKIYILQHEIPKIKNVVIQKYVYLFRFYIYFILYHYFSALRFFLIIIIIELLELDVLIVSFNNVNNVLEK